MCSGTYRMSAGIQAKLNQVMKLKLTRQVFRTIFQGSNLENSYETATWATNVVFPGAGAIYNILTF